MATNEESQRTRCSLGALAFAHAWASPSPATDVSTRCTRSGAWLVVEVSGELDLQAVPLLDTLGIDPCFVVLDLHGVTFMDCSGVRALLEARRRAVAAGGSVHLAAPSRQVLSLLSLTHLGRALPVFDSVSAAMGVPPDAGSGYPRPTLVHPRRSSGGGRLPE